MGWFYGIYFLENEPTELDISRNVTDSIVGSDKI